MIRRVRGQRGRGWEGEEERAEERVGARGGGASGRRRAFEHHRVVQAEAGAARDGPTGRAEEGDSRRRVGEEGREGVHVLLAVERYL